MAGGPRSRTNRRVLVRRTIPFQNLVYRLLDAEIRIGEFSVDLQTGEKKIVLSDDTPFSEHLKTLESVKGLSDFVLKHAKPRDHFERAFLMELVLEGLVQNLRIAREDLDSTVTYAELAKFNLMRSRG